MSRFVRWVVLCAAAEAWGMTAAATAARGAVALGRPPQGSAWR